MTAEAGPGIGMDPIFEREQAFNEEASRFDRVLRTPFDPEALQAGYARLEELTAADFGFGCDEIRLNRRYRDLYSFAHRALLKARGHGDEAETQLFSERFEELHEAITAINKPIANMRARVEERRAAEQSPRQ